MVNLEFRDMVLYKSVGLGEMVCNVSDRLGEVLPNSLGSDEENWETTTLLNSLHPSSKLRVSDWVLDKAREIQHYVGILCDGFEDQFIALLATVEDCLTLHQVSSL